MPASSSLATGELAATLRRVGDSDILAVSVCLDFQNGERRVGHGFEYAEEVFDGK